MSHHATRSESISLLNQRHKKFGIKIVMSIIFCIMSNLRIFSCYKMERNILPIPETVLCLFSITRDQCQEMLDMPREIIINRQTPITYYLLILLSLFHSVVSKIVRIGSVSQSFKKLMLFLLSSTTKLFRTD